MTDKELANVKLTEGAITLDQLNSLFRSILTKELALVVTDIRKGQAENIQRTTEISNQIMSLKNALMATNQALATTNQALAARSNGKKPAVVVVQQTEEPKDLFGNTGVAPADV